jgi:uncharacterized protein
MEKYLGILENELKKTFKKDYSHDVHHLKRVLKLSLFIQKHEGGDKKVIAIAALLHDVHRLIQSETDKYCSPKDSISEINKFLLKISLTEEQKEKILYAIECHESYPFGKNSVKIKSIEAKILQDADRLDATGAIGVARCFMYSGRYKQPLYVPEISLKGKYDVSKMTDPSSIHHFYYKLLKLGSNMNTKTGKNLASERHRFMEHFLKEFFDEWEGKK